MIGSALSRYAVDQQWLVYDTESNGVNVAFSLPWEIAWATFTLKDGLGPVTTRMIKWRDFRISPHLALKTHFDPRRYAAEARPPQEVWEEFAPLLYSSTHRAAGHNILGFDVHMVSVWRRLMGMPPDHSWMGGDDRWPLLDTDCLSKAHLKGWTLDISSPDSLLAAQHKAQRYIEKGLKTNLGAMCALFQIPYDHVAAHSAAYDIGRNALLLKELVWKVEC